MSYCWGERQNLVTTTLNLAIRRSGIPWPHIPQTLRDAILFAHHPGIHYIWIDALCILQDDMGDWMREASKMGEIYRNATLTLSATSSPNVSSGIFQSRPAFAKLL